MNQEHHEQLSHGVANATADEDDEGGSTSVRIVPIPEGEITTGQSGTRTAWDRDPIQNAVESGVLDGATIVKGEGGKNPHFPMDEQVPPENILGRVESWDYEEGVGPVGEADIVDEQMATRIDAGLLEVSPDLYRRLGDYDEERDADTVEEIIGMPRITVLERGAAENASIEPSMAEALGYNPDGERRLRTPGDEEQLSPLYPLRFYGYGDFVGSEFIDEAVENLNAIQGVSAVRSADSEDPELVAVLDRSEIQMDSLNESIISALEDTPFEVYEGFDWVERIGREQLAQDADTVDTDEETPNEPAEPGAETETNGTNDPMPDDEPTKEELREQLAAAKAELSQTEENLEAEREEVEELEEETEKLESEVEEKEEKINKLEEENEPLRHALAQRAAGDSALSAEALANSNMSNEELANSIVEEEDLQDDDDDRSPVEIVSEQLAASPAARGQPEEDDGTPGSLDEEQLAAANDWAYEALSGSDIVRVQQEEQLSPRDLVKQKTGVDPAECNSRAEFSRRAAEADAGGDD